LSGYWNVIVDKAEILCGASPTTSVPSPGADEEEGNGDAIEMKLDCAYDLMTLEQMIYDSATGSKMAQRSSSGGDNDVCFFGVTYYCSGEEDSSRILP
jgi:hypothetical protein